MKINLTGYRVKIIVCLAVTIVFFLLQGISELPGTGMMDSVMAAGDFMYFPYAEYTVSEGCGYAEILICRERQYNWYITADYSTFDSTATAGEDYTAVSDTKVMTMFLEDYLYIQIIDDALGEENETFTITLSGQYTIDDPANGYYKTCTVIIEDNDGGVSLSDNNILSSLEISNGVLEPSFAGITQSYEAMLPDTTGSITIKAVPEDPSATMQLNGITLQTDVWSNPINISYGINTVSLVVEAESSDLRTYSLSFIRDELPAISIATVPLSAQNGSTISTGSSTDFEGTHTVTVNDSSATGWGWKLWLLLDEYIDSEAEEVDDPSLPGNEWIEVKLPSAALCYMSLESFTRPDMSVTYPGQTLEITGAQLVFGSYRIEAASDSSGTPGTYTVELEHGISIPSWLPSGTILVSKPSGSFVEVGSVEMKQIYGGAYSYEITYALERIVQP